MSIGDKRLWIGFFVVLIGMGVGIYYFWPAEHPKAYIAGYTKNYSGSKVVAEFPSYVFEIDIREGVVSDSFPISENVPIVKSIALNKQANRLYVGGERNLMKQIPCGGIDIYDLGIKKLVDRIDFGTEKARIDLIRFSPNFNRLFIDRPLARDELDKGPFEEPFNRWVLDGQTHEVLRPMDYALDNINIISPDGDTIYRMLPEGRHVIDVDKDEIVINFKDDKKRMKKMGGYQPDPDHGFTLNYPQFFNIKSPELYDRDTMEKIGEIDLSRTDPPNAKFARMKAWGPKTWTSSGRYWVIPVILAEPASEKLLENMSRFRDVGDKLGRTYVKVIDTKKMKVIHTIRIGNYHTTNVVAP